MAPVLRRFATAIHPTDRRHPQPIHAAAVWLLALLVAAQCPILAAEPSGGDPPHHDHASGPGQDSATVRHRFEDAEHWAKVFEDPARDEWQKPEHVLDFIGLDSADLVADIGSATGYFDVRFARAVPKGKVFAIDIEPSLVLFLNRRAEEEGLPNLTSLVGEPADPHIPGLVDVVFLCDTYHHIDGRVAYFHGLQKSLLSGGRILIVDFKPGELPVGPGPAHKIESARIVAEMYAAGYDLLRSDETLPYQFILEFGVRPVLDLKMPGAGEGEGPP